jgi:uncharacterized membrane protein YjgN (DUF898 family)
MDGMVGGDATPVVKPTAEQIQQRTELAVRFTGSGSEYFRIWVVNLLLLLITFGLYFPWARVRRFKYFYNHTLIDGHALDFHGEPRRMLRGMAIVTVFLFVYSYASHAAAVAGVVAAIAICVLWPLIWRSSLKFRLANTSWRGLRFRFDGDVRGAFLVSGLPTALLLIPLALVHLVVMGDLDYKSPQGAALVAQEAKLYGLLFLLWGLALPWFIWRGARYQHGGYRFAQLATVLRVGPDKVYGVFFMALVVFICAVLAGAAVGAAVGFSVFGIGAGLGAGRVGIAVALAAAIGAAYVICFVAMRAYLVSRMQNLLWSRTGSRWLRFKSELRLSPTLWLMVKNWALILITLGLYWPFAAVALWRLRTEAITVTTRMPTDDMLDMLTRPREDVTGDLAADLGGVDLAW